MFINQQNIAYDHDAGCTERRLSGLKFGGPAHLICGLQGLLSEAKAEIRSVLSQHGISNFVIKPVMRNYAFELASIPRGMQWVLKVKYPSTARTLPLGLTGNLPCTTSLYCNQ